MPSTATPRLLPPGRRRLSIAALLLMACGIGIAVLAVDVMGKIRLASSASTDNVQWTLGQVEVEMLHLVMAVDDAADNPGNLAELRRRYDVFYNRLNILEHGSVFAGLREKPEFKLHFDRIAAFMARTAPLIDGPAPALADRLDDLSADLHGLAAEARQIALLGVQVFGANTDRRRAGLEQTLIALGLLTTVLVTTLVGMLLMLLRLLDANRQRAAQNAETLSRLNAVVATALDAVITVDGAGRIVDFNAAASATFGHARAEAVGASMADLLLTEPQDKVLFPPGAAPRISGQGRVRITARHKLGHRFPAEIAVTESMAGTGPLYVAFLRDLSAQVAAEQALVKARDDALAGEKAKADLLVVMSHEIRTPLNGMIGTIELMDSTDLQPHQREYLRIMEVSGKLLMHHVNDVLEIARLDSGKTPLSLGPVDLVALVGEVFDNQAPAALANGNRLTLRPPPDGRNRVIADVAQLRQVLLNLVGNAVKFTHDGSITVEIAHLSGSGPTELRVIDTGIGIAPADLHRIFDDFVTLDPSYARRASGTGLGLGIVRRIVGRMGGTLAVDSQNGIGSTFRIGLPLQILDAVAPLPAMPATGPARRPKGNLLTLVVEDNEFNRLIARDMLVREGHEVVEATDGTHGIRLAAARRFDLILMDISMPDTDGLQAAQAIRAGGGLSSGTPIIALTAHALPSDTERFRAGGMQQVLVKPITRETLHAAIASVLHGGTALPPHAAVVTESRLIDRSLLDGLAQDLGRERTETLTRRFLAETSASIDLLLRAASAGDADTSLIREVHRLEGSAGMFGALALHDALSRIETLCKAQDLAAAHALIPDLARLWQGTMAAYEVDDLPQLSSLR